MLSTADITVCIKHRETKIHKVVAWVDARLMLVSSDMVSSARWWDSLAFSFSQVRLVYGGQSVATKKSESTALCLRQSILIARDAHISSQHSLWYHTGEPISATVGLFTPWKLANTTTRAFSSSSQEWAANKFQACHWLYAINIFFKIKKSGINLFIQN